MRPSLRLCLRPVAIPPPFYVDPAIVSSKTISGFKHFTQPCRRIEFEFHQNDIRGEGLREYIRTSVTALARANPQTEVIVRSIRGTSAPVARAFYTTGRVRAVGLHQLRPDTVRDRVQKLLSQSGHKIVELKRRQVVAGPHAESARGVWSDMHVARPFNI